MEAEATARAIASPSSSARRSTSSTRPAGIAGRGGAWTDARGRRIGRDLHSLPLRDQGGSRSRRLRGGQVRVHAARQVARRSRRALACAGHRTLELVSSDHASWNYRGDKELGREDFTKIPNGALGSRSDLMLVYQGVNQGRLTLPQFVDLTATRPAQIFGLFPARAPSRSAAMRISLSGIRSGSARSGSPALHHAVDYTLYEGSGVRGSRELCCCEVICSSRTRHLSAVPVPASSSGARDTAERAQR